MALVVQKFGGSSVGNPEKIRHVARIIADTFDQGNKVAVVVSAMGDTTDDLVALANQLSENPQGREMDALLGTGEMVSCALVAMTLNAMGYKAVSLTGQQAGFRTEDLHSRARILEIDTGRVQYHLDNGTIVIVTGFQGVNSKGDLTTLGRGGSDTSAVALAGALGADSCDIYTDVDGVYSTDPRVVPTAKRLDGITYIEMLELARVGAQVLHPRAVETARNADVHIRVRSTFKPHDEGTLVAEERSVEGYDQPVSGVAYDDNQVQITLTGVPDQPGVAAKLFGSLARNNISVDMIIQSLRSDDGTNDIAFTINTEDTHDAKVLLAQIQKEMAAEELLIDEDVSKVSVVGVGMIDRPGIASGMFEALAKAAINIKMIATSEIKISCLIDKAHAKQAVQAIHHEFFPEKAATDMLVDAKRGY